MSTTYIYRLQILKSRLEYLNALENSPYPGKMPLLLTEDDTCQIPSNFLYINKDEISISIESHPSTTIGFIIGDKNDISGKVAKHYAAFLKRPFIDVLNIGSHALFTKEKNFSFTIFVPSSVTDGYRWKKNLEDLIFKISDKNQSIGYILNMDEKTLSKYLFKIIKNILNKNPPKEETSRAIFDRPQKDSLETIESILTQKTNSFLIHSHSRASCNRIKCTNNNSISICGNQNKGRGGRCLTNLHCSWGDNKKIPISEIKADFFFFNGCSTATIGDTGYGIPFNSTLGYSAMEGPAVNYIGNSHIVRCSEDEIDWMRLFLYLKFKPSYSARLINNLRFLEKRHSDNSCIFLGDAESPSLNTDESITCIYKQYSNKIYFKWNDRNDSLCIITKGDLLFSLSKKDLLSIIYDNSSQYILYGNVIYDEINDQSLLFLKKGDRFEKNKPINLYIKTKHHPANRNVGLGLEFASKQIRTYNGLGPYLDLSKEIDLDEIQKKAIKYRGASQNETNKALWFAGLEQMHIKEQNLLKKLNNLIISKVLKLAQQKTWSWEGEYLGNFHFDRETSVETACTHCGGIIHSQIVSSLLDQEVKRKTLTCTYCSANEDMPLINIDCCFIGKEPKYDNNRFVDLIYLHNQTNSDANLSFALVIANPIAQFDSEITNILLNKNQPTLIACSLRYKNKPSGIYLLKLYISVNGVLGYIGKYFIFR